MPASYGDIDNNHDSLQLVPCRQCWHPPTRAALHRYRHRNGTRDWFGLGARLPSFTRAFGFTKDPEDMVTPLNCPQMWTLRPSWGFAVSFCTNPGDAWRKPTRGSCRKHRLQASPPPRRNRRISPLLASCSSCNQFRITAYRPFITAATE